MDDLQPFCKPAKKTCFGFFWGCKTQNDRISFNPGLFMPDHYNRILPACPDWESDFSDFLFPFLICRKTLRTVGFHFFLHSLAFVHVGPGRGFSGLLLQLLAKIRSGTEICFFSNFRNRFACCSQQRHSPVDRCLLF